MVQYQKPKRSTNDRMHFFGGGPGIVSGDNFESAASSNLNADRPNSRSRR